MNDDGSAGCLSRLDMGSFRRAQGALRVEDPSFIGPKRQGLTEDFPLTRGGPSIERNGGVLREVQGEATHKASVFSIQLHRRRGTKPGKVGLSPDEKGTVGVGCSVRSGLQGDHALQAVDLLECARKHLLELLGVRRRERGLVLNEVSFGGLSVVQERRVYQQSRAQDGQKHRQHACGMRRMPKTRPDKRHGDCDGHGSPQQNQVSDIRYRSYEGDEAARCQPRHSSDDRERDAPVTESPPNLRSNQYGDAAPQRGSAEEKEPSLHRDPGGTPWLQREVEEVQARLLKCVPGERIEDEHDACQACAASDAPREQTPVEEPARQPSPRVPTDANLVNHKRRHQNQSAGEEAEQHHVGGHAKQSGPESGLIRR